MTKAGLSYQEAIITIRSTRPNACPNIGFEQQLLLLEAKGGDIDGAAKHWTTRHAKDVMEAAQNQREAANDVHLRLDTLENEIAAARSGGFAKSPAQVFVGQLYDLQSQINNCLGEAADRAAKTILKAASQKVGRLLKEFET